MGAISVNGAFKNSVEIDSGGGLSWLFKRGLPLVLLAGVAGVAVGCSRWAAGFVPGVQGMLVGGVLAWLAGRWAGAEDAHALWSPGQRFWLWLNVSLTCWLAAGATLSALHAPPLAEPLDWIGDVARGTASETFFGVRLYRPVEGLLSGTGWIAFNVFDLALFFVLGLIVLGVVAEKRLGLDGDEEDTEQDTATGLLQTAPPCRFSRRLCLIQWIAIALAFAGFQVRREPPMPIRFDPVAQARLRELTGRYVFDDGRRLLEPAGQGGAFSLDIYGGDGLIGLSEPDGRYVIRLDYDGRGFLGRIMRGSPTPVYIRARFSKDGRQLTLAGPTYRHGRELGEVVIEARRE